MRRLHLGYNTCLQSFLDTLSANMPKSTGENSERETANGSVGWNSWMEGTYDIIKGMAIGRMPEGNRYSESTLRPHTHPHAHISITKIRLELNYANAFHVCVCVVFNPLVWLWRLLLAAPAGTAVDWMNTYVNKSTSIHKLAHGNVTLWRRNEEGRVCIVYYYYSKWNEIELFIKFL